MTRASGSVVLTRGSGCGLTGSLPPGEPPRRLVVAGGLGRSCLALDLVHRGERLGQPLLAFAHRAFERGLLAPRARPGVLVQLGLERLHLGLRLGDEQLQPLAAPEAGGLGRRAHAQAVLGHHVQTHEPALQQRGDAAGELRVEPRGVLGAKVGQGVVVDAHTATQPAVGVVALAQPVDLAGRAHAVDGGPQPQRDEDGGVDRRAARRAFERADARMQRPEVERLHKRPDGARRVIRSQKRVQIAGAKFDLISLWRHQPRHADLDDQLAPPRWRHLQFTLVEQRNLALIKPRLLRLDAHASIDASSGPFVHRF